jgi:hypothetical protein
LRFSVSRQDRKIIVGIAEEYPIEIVEGSIRKAPGSDPREDLKTFIMTSNTNTLCVLIDALSEKISINDDLDVLITDLRMSSYAWVVQVVFGIDIPRRTEHEQRWREYLEPQFSQALKTVQAVLQRKPVPVVCFSAYWDGAYRAWVKEQSYSEMKILGLLAEEYSAKIRTEVKRHGLSETECYKEVPRFPSEVDAGASKKLGQMTATDWIDVQREEGVANKGRMILLKEVAEIVERCAGAGS